MNDPFLKDSIALGRRQMEDGLRALGLKGQRGLGLGLGGCGTFQGLKNQEKKEQAVCLTRCTG